MKRPGSVALGDVAARAEHIEVACTRCDRRGQYQLARLVTRLGPDYAMTDLGSKLSATCPNRGSTDWARRCDVFFPNLIKIMGDSEV